MSKSIEKKRLNKPRSSLRSHLFPVAKKNIYLVGVYFPELDMQKFEVSAHIFEMNKGTVYFFSLGDFGCKEFVASFTHVAYILIKDLCLEPKISHVEMPSNFEKVC